MDIDPNLIVINRTTRQRQVVLANIEELKASIAQNGIINPITVRQADDGTIILLAGERRLTAALSLGLTSVPARFLHNLTPIEAEVVELEENVKREDLSWRDHVRAAGRIHLLYRRRSAAADGAEWKVEDSARELSVTDRYLRKLLHVFVAIDDTRIAGSNSVDEAFNILQRIAERKAASVVGDMLAVGSSLFGGTDNKSGTNETTGAAEEQRSIAAAEAVARDLAAGDDLLAPQGEESVIIGSLNTNSSEPPKPQPLVLYAIPSLLAPVQQGNFHEWAKNYAGPKFSFIHCDFPYGNYKGSDSKGAQSLLETEDFYDNTIDIYWNLLDSLTLNLDRFTSYSAHLLFWFNMNFYSETVQRLRRVGLVVHDHPLVWHKTSGPGGLGVAPGTIATHPRRTYDTALLAVRGNRPLVRSMCNSYAAPTAGDKIHPSQKPEPMLRYFFQMFVDETTAMFDPTAGSGAALRAAEDLGAKTILGLELDPNYARGANQRTLEARRKRLGGYLSGT